MNGKLVKLASVAGFAAVASIAFTGCQGNKANSDSESGGSNPSLSTAVRESIELAKLRDPTMARWFETAHSYAVFPEIGAGGLIFGGGYGSGEVYSGGRLIGTANVTQLNVGATIGGQVTQQILFFKDQFALDRFTKGSFEFDAATSAVAIKSGIAASVDYSNGVAVFVMPKKGAMVQASVGTQKFAFKPS